MDFKELFIFEMANNHQGNVSHGLKIIKEMGKIAKKFGIKGAVKLQYRDLESFIHPDYKEDKNAKHIGRFLETALSNSQFKELVDGIRSEGLLTVCTPFDEKSVDLIEEHEIEVIKIASCSADDWPLLSRIAKSDKPVIASTGGLDISMIDNLVTFLRNRNKAFAVLHCVGVYPTPDELFNLNFISKLKLRYPEITIGYSGHEHPDNTDIVKIAAAKGAEIFERHVGVATDSIKLNAYSMNPIQTEKWVQAYLSAKTVLGLHEKSISIAETESLLSLKRGVFAKKKLKKGQQITFDDVFFAMPCQAGQLTSGEFGRVRARYVASKDYEINQPLFESSGKDNYYRIRQIIHQAKGMLNEAGIILSDKADVELSHHYGLENFDKFGGLIVTLINREYCKKIIVVFPGQHHPEQRHIKKEETFHILYGELIISLNGITSILKKGDIVTIERGVTHSFYSDNGAVFEEVSTTHFRNDSFYTDSLISEQDPMQRKTIVENF